MEARISDKAPSQSTTIKVICDPGLYITTRTEFCWTVDTGDIISHPFDTEVSVYVFSLDMHDITLQDVPVQLHIIVHAKTPRLTFHNLI